MSNLKIETGSSPAEERFSITVTETGPYLVYGRPPLAEQFIMPDESNDSWYFQEGRHFSTESEPTALCRCGASRRKPYCDGSHEKASWDPRLTAQRDALLDNAEVIDGGTLQMTDNEKYCVFARFCHPHGDAWSLTEQSDDPEARRLAVREASMCPSGRLMAWDKETMKPYEFRFEPSLGLIEDITIGASGGLWIRTKSATASSHAAADSRPTSLTATARMPQSSGGTNSTANRSAKRSPKRCTEPAATGRRLPRRSAPGIRNGKSGARLRRYPAGPPAIPPQHLPRYGKRGPSRTVLSSYFNPAQSRKRRFPQAFRPCGNPEFCHLQRKSM